MILVTWCDDDDDDDGSNDDDDYDGDDDSDEACDAAAAEDDDDTSEEVQSFHVDGDDVDGDSRTTMPIMMTSAFTMVNDVNDYDDDDDDDARDVDDGYHVDDDADHDDYHGDDYNDDGDDDDDYDRGCSVGWWCLRRSLWWWRWNDCVTDDADEFVGDNLWC